MSKCDPLKIVQIPGYSTGYWETLGFHIAKISLIKFSSSILWIFEGVLDHVIFMMSKLGRKHLQAVKWEKDIEMLLQDTIVRQGKIEVQLFPRR